MIFYLATVDPPAPIICPIGGRYSFAQIGDPWEKYYTRIRGITERPRHKIDCHEYISEFKSCDDNPKKLYVDAEYCNSVDHNARPISEYGYYVLYFVSNIFIFYFKARLNYSKQQ